MNSGSGVQLRFFGSPSIVLADRPEAHPSGPAVQRHRIALLALLALSPDRRLSRDKLVAHLWPESGPEQARTRLNAAVYVLRQAFGEHAILSDHDALRLNDAVLRADVVEFEEAIARAEYRLAVDLYRGPFLDGFFLKGALEFERWTERSRSRLADARASALEALAEEAEGGGDRVAAVGWWKKRAMHDPYDSRVAARLMEALATGGNVPGALKHGAAHRRLLEEEFGVGLPAEMVALEERLRSGSIQWSRPAPLGDPPPGGTDPRLPGLPLEGLTPAEENVTDETATVGTARDAGPSSTPSPRRSVPWMGAAAAATILLGSVVLLVGPGSGPPIPDHDTSPAGRPHRTSDLAVHELVRLGSDMVLLRSEAGTLEAREYLERAIALDPAHAEAHAFLAGVYLRLAELGRPELGRSEALRLAGDAARTAVALDPSSARSHEALGIVRMSMSEFRAAERSFVEALRLDPAAGRVRERLSSLYLWLDRPSEALQEAEIAVELDPLSPTAAAELARALAANGRCAEALVELRSLEALEPPLLRAGPYAAQCHARSERWSEGVAALRHGWELRGPRGRGLLGYLLARSGEWDEAVRVRDGLVEEWQAGAGDAFALVIVSAGLADLDGAFLWLDRAILDHSLVTAPSHIGLLEPLFEDLRRDPRFSAVRERLALGSE